MNDEWKQRLFWITLVFIGLGLFYSALASTGKPIAALAGPFILSGTFVVFGVIYKKWWHPAEIAKNYFRISWIPLLGGLGYASYIFWPL